MAAGKKVEPPTRFDVEDREQPDVARAISLALAVMKFAKVFRWEELGVELPPDIHLDQDQLDLVNNYGEVLLLLRHGVPKSGNKTTGVAICPVCHLWCLAGTSISGCTMTYGCPGRLKKIHVATRLPAGTRRTPKADPVQESDTATDPSDSNDDATTPGAEQPVQTSAGAVPPESTSVDETASEDSGEASGDGQSYDADGDFDD